MESAPKRSTADNYRAAVELALCHMLGGLEERDRMLLFERVLELCCPFDHRGANQSVCPYCREIRRFLYSDHKFESLHNFRETSPFFNGEPDVPPFKPINWG